MITKRKNISMMRGDTLSFGIQFSGLGGQNLDELYFSCSSNYMSTDYVFIKTIDDGITKSEDPEWPDTYIIRTVPRDTEHAIPGLYYYDIEAHVNDDVFTVMAGNLEIVADVTYEPENFFAEEQYVPDIDPNDFLKALDAVDNTLGLSNSEYIILAKDMSVEYYSGVKSFEGRFVKYGTNLYRAKTSAANVTAPVSNTDYWELIATTINVTPTEVEGVEYNIKDLFSNMMDYCNRSVNATLTDNKVTLDTFNKYVTSEATKRYSNDKAINEIIYYHRRVTRVKHSFTIDDIAANGSKTVTFNVSAEGACSSSKAVETKKMSGYNPLAIAGFKFNKASVVPYSVYISMSNDNGTGKFTVSIHNTSNSKQSVNGDVWILWSRKGDTASLSL